MNWIFVRDNGFRFCSSHGKGGELAGKERGGAR